MKIVADSHIPFVKEYFGAYGELILKSGREISPADVKEANILLVRSITRVDQALLQHSNVKFVGSVTAGADHLDTKYLEKTGINYSVAAGFNAPPVANYVVSVIAALQRRKLLSHERVKAAVIGAGHVGRLVIDCFKLFGFEVSVCDPIRAENEANFSSVPLADLSDCDVITLHVPLTRGGDHSTYHFIDEAFLKRQKSGCVLINASRGAVIDSQALMQSGRHLHWCFDVWENEPQINKNILEQAMIATPHIAGYSVQSKIRGIDMIYRIACEKNIIEPQAVLPLEMPHQQLSFAGKNHRWQDVILGVFNPLVMTAMMRAALLPAENDGLLFDEIRNRFNYRYEFKFTRTVDVDMSEQESRIAKQLGIEIGVPA